MFSVRSKVLILLGLAAFAGPARSAQWTRLTTPDFELYTELGEKQGKDTIAYFERLRSFFHRVAPERTTPALPVRVIQFSSKEEYRRYSLNESSDAYFTPGSPRFYIAMGDLSERGFGTAAHEYTHLEVQLAGLRLPLWLNEGWAEVNSSLRPERKETLVGDLISWHLKTLEGGDWLDFATLTTVDRNSPIYNEAARAGMFYAESWALVHMLYLSPDYQAGFGKFLLALNGGKSAEEACRLAWGKSPDEVYKDLKSYFDRKQLFGRAFETKFETATQEPKVAKITDFDSRLVLADLTATIKRTEQAKALYEKLDQEQPGRADVAESIGYLDLNGRDLEGARLAFERAFGAGDGDPYMCLQLSRLEAAAKQPPDRVIAPLERAVKAKPDFADARLQLGVSLVSARRFPEAIADLLAMPDVKPDRAPPLFCSLGYAYIETGDLVSARQNLATCRKWSKSERDVAIASSLTKLLEARSEGPAAAHAGEKRARVTGIVRQLQCSPAGNRIVLDADGKPLTFFIPGADAVELDTRNGGTLTISCGVAKPISVTLEYVPSAEAADAVAGLVRRIEF
jgi:tetratricopeptide (TPR) repeat protein